MQDVSIQDSQDELVKMFDSLGDGTRLQLLLQLLENPNACVSELAGIIGISPPAVSQQMRILELSGLVRRERYGQKVCYKLRTENRLLAHILPLIKQY